MILDRFLEIVFVCVVRLIFLSEREDRIDMPRGLMDNLEGKVIGEEVHEGGLENRLGSRPRGFESHSFRQKTTSFDRNLSFSTKSTLAGG